MDITWLFWIAGGVQLGIASANFFAIKMFDYPGKLKEMSPVMREVFILQNVFIVLTLVGLSLLCFVFAEDLAGASLLGRALSGFLALFWGLRLLMQLFFYSREKRGQYPVFDALFILAFVDLTATYLLGALGNPLA